MFYLRKYEHVSDPKFIANLFMQGWGEERTIPHPNIYYRTIIQAIIQPYSNGFTEGCNNLIKTVKRVAFGMRDFNRFRNRILYVNWQKRNSANALPSS